jgi:hypothetical protein
MGLIPALLVLPVVGLLVVPRVSIALPAIALDEALTLGEAWRLSRGNTWRLALATILCAIPAVVVASPLYWLFSWQTRASSVVLGTAASLVDAVFVTVGVTLLSLAYRCFAHREAGDGAPHA